VVQEAKCTHARPCLASGTGISNNSFVVAVANKLRCLLGKGIVDEVADSDRVRAESGEELNRHGAGIDLEKGELVASE
jgi:hypothetical protein